MLTFLIASGQSENPETLEKGIYIENTKTLVPWNVVLDSVKNYANPVVISLRKNYTEAQWENVEIFNGLKLKLIGYFWNPPGNRKLKHFYSYVDSTSIEKIKAHLDLYFGITSVKKETRKNSYYYEWRVFGCIIRTGRLVDGKSYFWAARK